MNATPNLGSDPYFSVIIPTYQRVEDLRKTLNFWKNQSFKNFEMIVSECVTPAAQDLVNQFQSNSDYLIHYVLSPHKGRTIQRNLAAKQARGTWLIFSDDHFYPHPALLSRYHALIESNASIQFIRGGVYFENLPDQVTDQEIHKCIRYATSELQNPFKMCITNNIAIRTQVFESIGGFDEDFLEYGYNDSELGCRLKEKNIQFHYLREAFGCIFSVDQPAHLNYQKFIEQGRSAYLLYKKHKKWGWMAGYHPLHIFWAHLLNGMGILKRRLERIKQRGTCLEADHFYLFLMGLLQGPQHYQHLSKGVPS